MRGDIAVVFQQGRSQKPADNAAVDFDKAIAMTGFGKFQILIIMVSGLIFAAAGFQNGLNSYVMPSAQCDLRLGSGEKGLLNAVFLAGSLSSAFVWGILADHIGRKKVLVATLLADGVVTLASSLSQSFHLFTAFRFLNGFLSGAAGSIVIPYLGEFIGPRHRSPCLVLVGFYWTLSWMLLPAIALAVLPITWSYQTANFTFNSWRIFVALIATPPLSMGLILAFFFPESPKFLFSQGREEETMSVLRGMYRLNYGKGLGDYPVKTILTEEKEEAQPSIMRATEEQRSMSVWPVVVQVWRQVSSLFSGALLKPTALASALMFTNMFAYYGLGLWLPELFNRFEEHYAVSNVSVTVCELTQLRLEASLATNGTADWAECDQGAVSPAVFLNTFIIGASCMVGTVLFAGLTNPLGFKALIVITTFVSGASAIAIDFLHTATQNLIVSCVFLAFVGSANTMICSAIVDIFPTRVRALAVCTAIFAGRLSAVLSNLTIGFLLDISCEVPIFLMGSVLLGGGILAFFIPKPHKEETKAPG